MTIVNIDAYKPHIVREVICVACHRRWIAVYPETALLKNLTCECGEKGTVIATGQELHHNEHKLEKV